MSDLLKPARPPRGLGAAGRRLWREIATQVASDGLILDNREAEWLRLAADEADQLARIMTELDAAPSLIVQGARNQDCEHPLLSAASRSRGQISRLLARLALEDPASAVGVGRGGRTTSHQARAAAMARNARRGA